MNYLLKSRGVRTWLVTTSIILVIMITINVLASTMFFNFVSLLLGGRRTVVLSGDERTAFSGIEGADTKETALTHGNQVSIEVCEEGYVLLKNNNAALPLEKGAKVSVFGKNSVNMAISGSGSGGGLSDDIKTIFDSLTSAGFSYNEKLKAFYENSTSGDGRSTNPQDLDNGVAVGMNNLWTGETPQTSYPEDVKASYADYADAALIVITRIGGEGFDMPAADDGSHFLQLDQNEKDLIRAVADCGEFKHVIILLNSPSALELMDVKNDSRIDGVIWMGYSGAYGIMALGELLCGEKADGTKISPSGRTVDTYAAVFSRNPTWVNFGGALNQTNGVSGDAYITLSKSGKVRDSGQHFVDYEEGIYVGYRYYETAYAEAQMGNYLGFDYDQEVVYPFGYGLSYTDFQWTLENADAIADQPIKKDEPITFRVNVTNVGAWPSREVVELYATPPYTRGGIEKSAKVLVGFEKTDILAPGEHAVVEITVNPYDLSSYDYNDANHNGFKGYELESGIYVFSVSRNAHEAVQTVEVQLGDSIRYETAANQFTDQGDPTQNTHTELGSVLSRADFAGTWPEARTMEEKQADKEFIARLEDAASHPNNPNAYSELPAQGAKEITMKFSELAGAAYDDPKWEEFLNQLTVAEMVGLVNEGAFHTKEIERLGVPRTLAADGPVGFCNFMGDPSVYGTCVYPCEVTLASTWNADRLYDMGESVGNEGLVGNVRGDGSPYTGWYAPGLNIHRSPLGGRNFEYYSEDCFLSGMMAAAVTKGAASKGVYTCLKHFALNEQETHRSGTATWATEQAIREVYIKGFEHAVRAGDAKGVMSSFNRIGERWTGGDYRLLTGILRDEWGFQGLVICDFNTHTHMNVRDMVYAGGDHNLETAGFNVWKNPDPANAADVTVLRKAAKNILYVVANTNGMRSDFVVKAPVWQILLYVADGVLAALLILWGVVAIKKARKQSAKTE